MVRHFNRIGLHLKVNRNYNPNSWLVNYWLEQCTVVYHYANLWVHMFYKEQNCVFCPDFDSVSLGFLQERGIEQYLFCLLTLSTVNKENFKGITTPLSNLSPNSRFHPDLAVVERLLISKSWGKCSWIVFSCCIKKKIKKYLLNNVCCSVCERTVS